MIEKLLRWSPEWSPGARARMEMAPDGAWVRLSGHLEMVGEKNRRIAELEELVGRRESTLRGQERLHAIESEKIRKLEGDLAEDSVGTWTFSPAGMVHDIAHGSWVPKSSHLDRVATLRGLVGEKDARIAELEGEVAALRTKVKRASSDIRDRLARLQEHSQLVKATLAWLEYAGAGESAQVPPSPPAPCGGKTASEMEHINRYLNREMARSLGLKDEVMESIGFQPPEYVAFLEWWSANRADCGTVATDHARRIWVAACRRQEKSNRKGGK